MIKKTTDATHPSQRVRVVECWRDLGYSAETIEGYLQWVERHRVWCRARGLDEVGQLTRCSVDRFARRYARARQIDARTAVLGARPAVHTWAKAVSGLGFKVPVC